MNVSGCGDKIAKPAALYQPAIKWLVEEMQVCESMRARALSHLALASAVSRSPSILRSSTRHNVTAALSLQRKLTFRSFSLSLSLSPATDRDRENGSFGGLWNKKALLFLTRQKKDEIPLDIQRIVILIWIP
ncbi:hypothetical protein SKAU_G00394900 [Synaphobranchus kaupii]|uniref:Uncharacterized protein n=1 Tax=Synaphobranchus kaupii TaxID=118154 RepID=A0A9Q1EC99_SYNKA|nr:hypothetical protein SKAU_G00394900 [Synaphobranchus kaupii]